MSIYTKQGNLFAAWDASRSAKIMCAVTVVAAILFDTMVICIILLKPEAGPEDHEEEGHH